MHKHLLTLAVLLFAAGAVMAGAGSNDDLAGPSKERVYQSQQAYTTFQAAHPYLKAYKSGALTTRLYGTTFGTGFSAESVADQFVQDNAHIFGVDSKDLVPGRPNKDGGISQPVMYDEATGQYRFTLSYFRQEIEGIPVFRSELRLLTRNTAGNELVLAVSTLKDLDGFVVDGAAKGTHSAMVEQAVQADEPSLTDLTEQEVVIFAGDADIWQRPHMAATLIASNDFPEKYRYVVDIYSGEILLKENMIIFEDVVGHVEGLSTGGHGAEQCEEEIPFDFKWARVNIGGTIAYTDERGDFTIPNGGSSAVTVESRCTGTWFDVTNYLGAEVVVSSTVTPPGPVTLVQNALNNNEQIRAQVNGYVHPNIVREFALAANPSYPQLMATDFPVSVNRTDGYCPGNAWYDYVGINFCLSGGSYPNTSWSSVVYHEYGHHLISVGGSGQGAYGEGMSDCVSVLILDNPELGLGFYGDCVDPLRNADNDFQYPCSGAIHYCGQLLSGCVWSTRNEMAAGSQGQEFRAVIRNLTINSILLHTGTEIDPSITIDFLTLDDDDGNLANGSPHYYEIAAGFGAHNMDAPPLSLLVFSYPSGQPTLLTPNVVTSIDVVVDGQEAVPQSGTGMVHYKIDGGTLTSVAMVENTPNNYTATLPAVGCFQTISYYFSAETTEGTVVYDPEPSGAVNAFAATDQIVLLSDDFESDQGWTFSGGQWAIGTPTGGGGQYGNPDPSSGHSGTGVLGYNLNGDYGNSLPEYHATYGPMDCSQLVNAQLSFWRWLGVETSSYDHAYLRVSNNGSSWTTLWQNTETVEDNSWSKQEFDISAFADGQPTVYIRFTMGTTDGSWQYCGWNIDDLEVVGYTCDDQSLQVTTSELPDWTVGVAYSEQLEAANGTGNLTWTDRDGDLVGTGLSLSSDGLLAGTPVSAGPIDFVAQVTDESKATAEKALGFIINPVVTITTTSCPDWTQGVAYSEQLTATGGTGSKTWSDLNGDLSGTGLLLTAAGLLAGTPTSAGPISFTALAADQIGAEDQAVFTFTINAAVNITTESLPDGNDGASYSQQLYATGGTGAATWNEVGSGLGGSGLSLDAGGLVSGTATGVQIVTFTARAADPLGSSDEQLLTIDIRPSYVCGDVNGNGEGPDIDDLTYLVNYMFQGGPPPPAMGATDVNGNGVGPDIEDLIYLVSYMFAGGPDLICE
ncbi:MAG: hypothetical protein ABIE70_06335 [bacterium]